MILQPSLRRLLAGLTGLLFTAGALGLGAELARGTPDPQAKQSPATPKPVTPPPISLYEQRRIDLSAPPPLAVETDVKCDQRGRIYAAYTSNAATVESSLASPLAIPLSRISPGSGKVVQYVLQSSAGYQREDQIDYDVTPWGTVYYLLDAYRQWPRRGDEEPDHLIVKFDDDGTVASVTKLDAPAVGHLQVARFAAFPSGGEFLVTGTLVLSAAERKLRPFTGIYGQDGGLVMELTLPRDVSFSSGKQKGRLGDRSGQNGAGAMLAINDGEEIGAPDGNLYVLRATNPPTLYTVSASGEVLKEVRVRIHEPGMTPIGISLAGGSRALLELGRIASSTGSTGAGPTTVLVLIDLATGEVTGTFVPPTGSWAGFPACATSGGTFEFLGTSKQNKLQVVDLTSR